MNRSNYKSEITGHLDIFVNECPDEQNNNETWNEILIHGDPEGLRSLAKLLFKIADSDQEKNKNLPIGAREHIHLRPKFDLSISSEEVIIGRLDAKGTGKFYERYISISEK